MSIYLIWKLLHLLAAVIFLGNITIGIFWKLQADKSKDRLKIADTFRNLIKADRILTMPSVTLLIFFGIATAMQGDYPLIETTWIFLSILMVIISAFVFMSKVTPVQKKILALCSNEQKFNWTEYESLSKQWNIWGSIATITPYIAVVVMVLKP